MVAAAKILQTSYNSTVTRLYNTYRTCIYSHIAYYELITMKNRSRTELASNILEAANGGANKTKIMYRAFLSYAQLKEYLAMLTQNGLMVHELEGEMYRTTSNGIKFLESSRQLGALLTPVASEKRLA
jgi:predicted transcriptional regulator